MKLFVLPLTRALAPRAGSSSSAALPLFYLHAQRSSLPPPPSLPGAAATKQEQQEESTLIKYLNKATSWGGDQWVKLGQKGKEKKGGWQDRVYGTGEKLMDKIEYEEWALKAIDPALSPKPVLRLQEGLAKGATEPGEKESAVLAKVKERHQIDLLYPPSLLSEPELLSTLRAQLAHREPHHRSSMYKCLWVAPLTFPFAIVPIVPNFPLFYVLWRAWSHWRAWKASSYLSSLFAAQQVSPIASQALDKIYSSASSAGPELLNEQQVAAIVKEFGMKEEEGEELKRGVQQARLRSEKERERLEQEQKEGKKE